ncbi:hypothetical protein GpartN1_g7208.t1 [Galdieria partita]|uniref:Uncharacterized protein n=1 Tax=Galdieria partita TaxID=83374 RepID=A0A9C7Q5Q4_9RHOD|nr:hypothetical protein GpartN1_g7208.t1 [Galdieria partita]
MIRNAYAFQWQVLGFFHKKFSRATCTTINVNKVIERRNVWKNLKSCSELNKAESNTSMEELLNPARLASLQRRYEELLEQFEHTLDKHDRKEIEVRLQKLERSIELEKRCVMTSGLRRIFVVQALVSLSVGGLLAANKFPFIQEVPLVFRALGFWMVWLFTIPSLRARKPKTAEKNALNVAFLACPVVNIVAPLVNKDTSLLWFANVCLVLSLYGYYVFVNDKAVRIPLKIRGILRYLDWGSWR